MGRYISIQEPQYDYTEIVFEHYLKEYYFVENVFNIDNDVDFIYDKFFKFYIDRFNKENILPDISNYGKIQSKELKSKEAVIANKNNPIIIYCGVFNNSNYNPNKKEVYISFNIGAIEKYSKRFSFSKNDLLTIEKQFEESSIKASIYHELSHWLSDSLYNNYLYTLIMKTKNININDPKRNEKIKKILNSGKMSRDASYYEVDAQVYAIKQLKRDNKKEWNNLTFLDLLFMYSPLRKVAKDLYNIGENVYKEWVNDLFKRLHREKLLGDNMKNIPEYKMFESKEIEELYII